MKKQNENLFFEKFRLLHSQEHSEDIKWSSSSSSESESTCCNEKFTKNRRRYSKCKRKKNALRNVSNLDITVIESCKKENSCIDLEKSPILKSKRVTTFTSPVLTTTRFPPNCGRDSISPILSVKRICQRSPVLHIKNSSPKFTGRVKKKLCYETNSIQDKSNSIKDMKFNNAINEIRAQSDSTKITENEIESIVKNYDVSMLPENLKPKSNESNSSSKSNLLLKVKDFFDSHFSSEHTSQNIDTTDTTTPSDSSKNDDVDILSCKTQSVTILQSIKKESSSNSDATHYDGNIKKLRYKKGGLAYRMNTLIKKQNAHVSLWKHERFLANNSNFVIPKEENIVFRIQKFDFKYGCYLLNAVDMDNKNFLISINKKYVNTDIIKDDSMFKLYEPYKILSIDPDIKIIVNVCKFEFVTIKQ